jgi:proline iminopeptidase
MFSAKDWENDANKLISRLPNKIRKVIQYCHEIKATDAKVYREAMLEYYLRYFYRDKEKLLKFCKIKNENGGKIYHYMWGENEFKPTGTLKSYTRTKQLNQVHLPTMVICGQHDEATPETGQKYAEMMPNAQFLKVPDAAHAILRERPEYLVGKVRQFLNGLEIE